MLKLEALYDFTTDESNILIHHSEVEICINQNTYVGDGEVRLELIPKAKIHFYGHFQGVPAQDALGISVNQTQISSFSINGCQIEGFRLKSGGDVISQQFNLQWSPKREPINVIGNNSSQMTFLIFHLFNFKDFVGTRRSIEQVESETYSIEHVDLICNKWNIELKSLRSTQDNINKLKEKGGYRLTHIGGIKKTDGTLFTGEDAADCLEALSFFLSFAKGAWCVPICAVGFDTSDNRVWASWASPNASWQVPFSWFDPHNGIQLTSFFTSFMNKIENSEWYEALHEVVYWYLNANNSSRGIDAGIILTQAAIERLSYEYVVKDKRLLTVNGFKELWASDRFRLLFSSLGIPLEIPKDTPQIENLSKKFNWLDAPHALTEIRNSLVHPEHKMRGQYDSAYFEAWNLGLWYLEMSLLAICGYSGKYGNRLKQRWGGDVEDVPWAKK